MSATKNSFVKNAKERDFYLDINYLNLKGFKPSVTDVTITIDKRTENRPDLLAHELYADSNLWWVFTLRNPDLLKDPVGDMVAGLKIKVPTLERVQERL